ncbi:LuxR C-terminal-related transcriptional regulator [Qipengyuania sp. JC766]|uniref:helix-turn-helix transcriptional regulator n=1 Tax=Qipengyuania sp. JC766 TaxID=3232139 RepID=UPI00345A3D05
MALSIDDVLDAALDETKLRDLLRGYAGLLDAKGYAAGWTTGRAIEDMFLWENDWTEEMVARYHAEFAQRDLWTIASLSDPRFDTFVRMTELVPPDVYAASPLWTELLEPGGDDTFYALGIKTQLGDSIGGVTFYRRITQSDFTDAHLAAMREDERVLGRLIGVRARVALGAAAARTWRAVVDSYAGEVYVVTPDRHLLDCNAAAKERLDAKNGLRMVSGKLRAVVAGADAQLEEQLRLALTPTGIGSCAIRRPDGTMLRYQLLRTERLSGQPQIIILGELPQTIPATTQAYLKQMFGLSPAEADVIVALAEGKTTAEVVEKRGSSYETVRSQYRAALKKMDCPRLVDAVALLRRTLPLKDNGRTITAKK